MIDDIALSRSVRQLREDYLNAVEVGDDMIEVPTGFVEDILERIADWSRLAVRVAELEAEREQRLTTDTPLTQNLFINLMGIPNLGTGRAAVTLLDTNDGQTVDLGGVYVGGGIRRVPGNLSHPAYDEVTVKVALLDPLPGEDVPHRADGGE